MEKWQDFLDSLDSPGGHVLIMLTLLVGVSVLLAFGFKVEAHLETLMALLAYALRGTPKRVLLKTKGKNTGE